MENETQDRIAAAAMQNLNACCGYAQVILETITVEQWDVFRASMGTDGVMGTEVVLSPSGAEIMLFIQRPDGKRVRLHGATVPRFDSFAVPAAPGTH